jgi:hypothetical protein
VADGSRARRPIDPVEQVRATKYALRGFAVRHPRWNNRNHIAWAHGIVTPYSEFPAEFATSERPRWSLHDRREQDDLTARVADSDDRAAEADRLTQEQATILQVSRLLRRVEVRGGPCSGKTVLALQQARELTRGRSGERKPQRGALLCSVVRGAGGPSREDA